MAPPANWAGSAASVFIAQEQVEQESSQKLQNHRRHKENNPGIANACVEELHGPLALEEEQVDQDDADHDENEGRTVPAQHRGRTVLPLELVAIAGGGGEAVEKLRQIATCGPVQSHGRGEDIEINQAQAVRGKLQ